MPVTANFAGPVQTDGSNHFRMLQSMARSHQGIGQSVTGGVWQALAFDTNDYNTDGIWSSGANTKFTAQIAGRYLITGGVNTGVAVNGLGIRVNGSGGGLPTHAQTQTPGGNNAVVTDALSLAAGDYAEIVFNPSGNTTLSASQSIFGLLIYLGE